MYIPTAFQETRPEVLHAFIREHAFGTLISHGASALSISHLPMLLDEKSHALVGHLARSNRHWHDFVDGADVTAMFSGPHAYISPRWYATRARVPTWNYANVYVYGRASVLDDRERLEAMLNVLTTTYEGSATNAWSMSELPDEMRQKLVDSIVGIEIEVTKIEGKFKLNQNRTAADRHGVIAALQSSSNPHDRSVAELMRVTNE